MTTFEEEWAQLKQQAAERTNLAGADNAGPSGYLKADRTAWQQAAKNVGSLRGNVTKSLAELDSNQSTSNGSSTTGDVESAASQRALYGSWKSYLIKVNQRCKSLQEILEKTGSDESKNEQTVKSSFQALDKKYKDTPAVGGESQGK